MPIATTRRPEPRGILQDAGEVEVLTADSGQIRHRHALVIAFTSEADLRRALEDHRCAYRDGQAIEERIAHG